MRLGRLVTTQQAGRDLTLRKPIRRQTVNLVPTKEPCQAQFAIQWPAASIPRLRKPWNACFSPKTLRCRCFDSCWPSASGDSNLSLNPLVSPSLLLKVKGIRQSAHSETSCVTVSSMHRTQIIPQLPREAKVLFIRLRSLGDTILSTPLFAALKNHRPDLRLSVLVEEPNQEVLFGNPDIESVFLLPPTTAQGFSVITARATELAKIRAKGFHCCINLHGGTTGAWFTWLSRARHRVGLSSFRNSFCYNVRIDLPSRQAGTKQHTVEYQIEWLRALGLPSGEIPSLRIFPDPALEPKIRDRLEQYGVQRDTGYCVIQPTSKFHTKEWTPSGFAEIAEYLETEAGYRVILTGGTGEKQKLEQVAAKCRTRPVILATSSISELVWVIKEAKLFVGNDSGPTHLAAALNVPTIVLFGSSDSKVWYPWKVAHQLVQNPFHCNPCPGYRCLVYTEPLCILSISPQQVKQAIERLLPAHKNRSGNHPN
jgi:predicted lipopolysaccharide heptosyltransferase III